MISNSEISYFISNAKSQEMCCECDLCVWAGAAVHSRAGEGGQCAAGGAGAGAADAAPREVTDTAAGNAGQDCRQGLTSTTRSTDRVRPTETNCFYFYHNQIYLVEKRNLTLAGVLMM